MYTLGEFKDDQLQNITGALQGVIGSGNTSSSSGAFNRDAHGGSGVLYSGTGLEENGFSFNASRVARTGTSTHGKQLGVNYIIKY